MPPIRGRETDAGNGSFMDEELKRQSLSDRERKDLAKISAILERADQEGKNVLVGLSPARIDMYYADGAKKLRENPDIEYEGLKYEDLTSRQQEFIDAVVEAADRS